MERNMSCQAESLELAIIGANRVVGEEDALEGGVHQNSAQCLSQKAEVLEIDKDEFLKILRAQQNQNLM